MAFCEQCGTRLDEGAKFCVNCGAKTAYNEAATNKAQNIAQKPESQNVKASFDKFAKKHPVLAVIGGSAIILIVLYFGIINSGVKSGADNIQQNKGTVAATQENVTDVDINTLLSEIDNNAARAQQLYGNKTIRTRGRIEIIDTDSVNIGVSGLLSVMVFPTHSEMSKLLNLQKGQTITVRGVFYTLAGFGYIKDAVIETNSPQATAPQQNQPQNTGTALSYNESGVAAYNRGDYDRAIADFTQALRLDPNSIDAYVERGSIYNIKGNYDLAIADFTQALRLNSNDIDAYNNRGVSYYYKGDWDRAIADFTQALRLDPNNPVSYINRGYAYISKGDLRQARIDVNKSLQLDPNYQNAKDLDAVLRGKGY